MVNILEDCDLGLECVLLEGSLLLIIIKQNLKHSTFKSIKKDVQ